jgi:hypothetical protein
VNADEKMSLMFEIADGVGALEVGSAVGTTS